jgi:prepilin-type N-terminal cleavage/methylation domain-containing protein
MVGRRRRGFTIVELLVVIAIIGILLAQLLPALEAARITQCRNDLKQLGLSAAGHQTTQRHFPSGGFGWDWIGDPDRGFGPAQLGGWAFNLLPFIEAKERWRLGKGIDFDKDPVSKKNALVPQITAPMPVFYCPSRCSVGVRPYTARDGGPLNRILPEKNLVAKSDYTADCGDQDQVESTGGPKTFAAADNDTCRTGSANYPPMAGSRALPNAPHDDWYRFGSAHTQQFSAVGLL